VKKNYKKGEILVFISGCFKGDYVVLKRFKRFPGLYFQRIGSDKSSILLEIYDEQMKTTPFLYLDEEEKFP